MQRLSNGNIPIRYPNIGRPDYFQRIVLLALNPPPGGNTGGARLIRGSNPAANAGRKLTQPRDESTRST